MVLKNNKRKRNFTDMLNDVAKKLIFTENILKYRLDRILELTGKNPGYFEDFYLYVIYVLHKLIP